ncbi:MAG: hypothetical protein ACJ763_02300 [Bdellovibrionia bacterium]
MKRPNSSVKHPVTATLNKAIGVSLMAGVIGVSGCTGQIPNSFRLAQQSQNFGAQLQINTKIDLLWVVDNSASMDTVQDKLRNGLTGFANKYMLPTWDIRVAVITTDTYLANPAFQTYFNATAFNSANQTSTYLASRTVAFNDPTFVDGTGKILRNTLNKDVYPKAASANYAKLIPGLHDGPIAAFCSEAMPYFLNGETRCDIRDKAGTTAYNGTSHCLSPSGSETAITQCVNTTQNDTVHSGKAIISTMPASNLTGAALTAWTQQLAKDFIVNATTGSAGGGSERGLQSVIQFMTDNEVSASPTKFFRANSARGIIFVTDEDDQTMDIEAANSTSAGPYANYVCDKSFLLNYNTSGALSTYCCTGGSCSYTDVTNACPDKVVDGTHYRVGLCPVTAKLKPVSSIKTQLDSFFLNLDGAGATDPNYFVAVITPLTASTLDALRTARLADDAATGQIKNPASDRGDRYLALADLVPGSVKLDLGASDYSPLLDQIGQAIILKKSTFPLSRIPTGQEDMIVTLVHGDGSSTVIPASKYTISGSNIVINDQALVLSFAATDTINVNYQPKFVNQ